MLNLYNVADDLEGLTNQVAALLVIHARNIKNNNICSSAELERSITRCMDRFQKVQWRELSLVVAAFQRRVWSCHPKELSSLK